MLRRVAKFVLGLMDIIVIGIILSSLGTTLDIWSSIQMFWGNGEKVEVEFGPVSYPKITSWDELSSHQAEAVSLNLVSRYGYINTINHG